MAKSTADGEALIRSVSITLAVLLVWRIGAHVPVPGIASDALMRLYLGSDRAGLAPLLSMSAERLSVFALGIAPYIQAWVIRDLCLLAFVGRAGLASRSVTENPRFERWLKVTALAFAAFQGWFIAIAIEGLPHFMVEPGLQSRIAIAASLVTGTAVLMWLADVVSRHGICNGVWLLASATILISLAPTFATLAEMTRIGTVPVSASILVLGLLLLTVAVTVLAVRARAPGAERVTLEGALPASLVFPILAFFLILSGTLSPSWNKVIQGALSPGAPTSIILQAVVAGLMIFAYASARMTSRTGAFLALAYGLAAAVLVLVPDLIANTYSLPVAISGLGMMIVTVTAVTILDTFGISTRR